MTKPQSLEGKLENLKKAEKFFYSKETENDTIDNAQQARQESVKACLEELEHPDKWLMMDVSHFKQIIRRHFGSEAREGEC